MVAVPMDACSILSNLHRQQAKSHAELQSQPAISHLESMGYVLLLTFCCMGVVPLGADVKLYGPCRKLSGSIARLG